MFADMTSNFLASRAGPLSDLVNLHNLQLHCKRFVHLSASDDVSQGVIFGPNISSLLRAVSGVNIQVNWKHPVWASFSFISIHPLSFYAQETNYIGVHYILKCIVPKYWLCTRNDLFVNILSCPRYQTQHSLIFVPSETQPNPHTV